MQYGMEKTIVPFKINLDETIIKQLIATLDTSSLGYIDW